MPEKLYRALKKAGFEVGLESCLLPRELDARMEKTVRTRIGGNFHSASARIKIGRIIDEFNKKRGEPVEHNVGVKLVPPHGSRKSWKVITQAVIDLNKEELAEIKRATREQEIQ